MVDPNNPSETANAVVKLLTDKPLAHQLGEAGRIRVLQEFSGLSAIQKFRDVMPRKEN
jgi:glycosyltransferase involved in cell wall biosynthesis